MPTLPATRASRRQSRIPSPTAGRAPVTRFDRRLGQILDHATEVFCLKGYEGASMRDLSRATGMSLAGLYYYFQSKERLLFLIQKHTFTTILEKLKARLDNVTDPEQRIRIFILNHLQYFVSNQQGLKVLSHEDESLKNSLGSEIAGIKREYYRICLGLMEDLRRGRGLDFNARTAALSLFGMINWIYTWYNPRVDGNAEALAEQMGNIVLTGVTSASLGRKYRKTPRVVIPTLSEAEGEGSAVRRQNYKAGHN
jgi:TetR/AcrR family transcriptional regulator, cholesterol catabolism regulator